MAYMANIYMIGRTVSILHEERRELIVKTLIGNVTAFSVVGMLFLSMMAVFPVQATEEIYLVPSLVDGVTVGVGGKFNVTIYIKNYNNPNVFSWQVRLNIVNMAAGIIITNAWIACPWGANLPDYIFLGRATSEPGVLPFPNTVIMGVALLGGSGETPPPNPASLGIVEFQVTKAPSMFETLSTVLDINNADTFVRDDNLNARDPIKTDGTYRWIWVVPPTYPHLAIVPQLIEMNPAPHNERVIGSYFYVEVWLKNLDIGWDICDMSFALKFNTTVIDTEVANITVNTIDWDGPWGMTVTHGVSDRIDAFVITTQRLGGDVLVLTIKFRVLNTGVSLLDTQDVFLGGHVGPIGTDPGIDGVVIVYAYLLGDLNLDGKVDIRDIATAASAFGSYPSHPRWNRDADITGDLKVDIRDLALIARNFGKTNP